MNLAELQTRALEVADQYRELNLKVHGKEWTATDYMSGFVGDVGDLSKIVMAKNGLRTIVDVDEKLRHELSDCLWSLLVLAAQYEINLEHEFLKNMKGLERRIAQES
jgi:NTP pyrophosphatase (non-canonical NTP hydrolase)